MMIRARMLVWGLQCLFAVSVLAGNEPTVVLGAGSLWRKYYSYGPPRLSVDAAHKLGVKTDDDSRAEALKGSNGKVELAKFYLRYLLPLETPPPPAKWEAADFDDSGWIHAPGVEFATDFVSEGTFEQPPPKDGSRLPYVRGADPGVWEMQLVCMRGRFIVKNLASVKKLRLSLTYRGGFIARLNGTEVARGGMPQGPVTLQTAAEAYPANASVSDAVPPRSGRHADSRPENQQYWPLRERSFGPVDISPALLHSGTNMLTLEMHRSDYPAECKDIGLGFSPVGLSELLLESDASAASFVGSTSPPPGLRVWTAEPWEMVLTSDFADAAEPLRPLIIQAARNGEFHGQVVAGSTEAIVGFKAGSSPLKLKGGRPEGAPLVVQLRCASVNPTHSVGKFRFATGISAPRFDMLLDTAPTRVAPVDPETIVGWSEQIRTSLGLPGRPAASAVLPVWITVKVPRNATPGDYEGSVTVSAKGHPTVNVPVRVHVADWVVPDVKDYASVMFVYESPDTLAEYYKVKPWSTEHWQLVERSLALLGKAGNAGLILPLLAESQQGNAESLVTWKKKTGGTYVYDFTNFDRYLALAVKYHDPNRLKAVVLDVWGNYLEDGKTAAQVTLAGDGNMKLPEFGTPACETLWRPLLLAARERLRKAGVADKLMLGTCCDAPPDPSHVAMFRNILPEASWLREAHHPMATIPYDPRNRKNVVPVGLTSIVYGHIIEYGPIPDPEKNRIYGWMKTEGGRRYNETRSNASRVADPIILSLNRPQAAGLSLGRFADPWQHHMLMENSLVGGFAGFGRVGGDYFRFRGDDRTLFLRYPATLSDAWNKSIEWTTPDMLGPGPNGAVATVRWENTRAGIQEGEARIFIEKALTGAGRRPSAALAKRCQSLLDARTRAMQTAQLNWTWEAGWRGDTPFGEQDWRASCGELFSLAAEVSRTSSK